MATSNEIKKVITVDVGGATTSIKDYKKHIDDLRGSLLQLDESSEEYQEIAKEIAAEQDKLNEVMKVGKTTTDAAEGSYNQLTQTMAELKKQWKATADEAERAELGSQILDINNQLKELDQSTGDFHRSVGDYANAFEQAFDKCLDGIKTIDGPLGELGGTVKNLIPVIKSINSTATAGLSGIKKGIAATGIGLLVVAVGELAAHWKDITGFLGKAVGLQTDYTKEVELAKTQMDGYLSSLKEANKELNTELQILGLQGKSRSELLQIEIDGLKAQSKEAEKQHQYWANLATNTRNKQLKEQYQANEQAALQEYNRLVIEYQSKEKLQKAYAEKEAQSYIDAALEEEAARKKAKEDALKTEAEKIAELRKLRDKNKDLIPSLSFIPTPEELGRSFELHKQEVGKKLNELQTFYENQEFDLSLYEDEITYQEKLDAQFEMDKAYIDMRISLNQELLEDENITEEEKQKLLEDTDKLQQDLLKKEKKYNAEKRKDAKATAEFKKKQTMIETQQAIAAAGSLFGALKDFYEEDSEEYKGLAIMEAILNGLQAIMGTWAGYADMGLPGTIAAGIQTAMIVATTAATIAKMKSTNKNSSGSGSISAPQVPQLSATTVTPLLDETADLNRLEENGAQGDSASEDRNLRVYVVDQDIRDANHKAEVVENNATF